ncbi:energy transducer TonB [Sphingomonas sp. SUN019]|uniref:energy transducer TonB n=1 Tax=Sphingomonas sp. SUN019 TaxID=2937788 RepID=UPI002164715D|nr:energy transducer TonB [Sphingomonas sp. SUN019]UVO52190.1 energy transducer TonB [Sphingomonas sp. SUN019]
MNEFPASGYGHTDPHERVRGALFAVLVQGVLLYVLIAGLSVKMPQTIGESLKIFDALPEAAPPPPPTTKPHEVKSKRPEGAASPPNLRARASEIVAPPPIVPLIIPPPVLAAPKAGLGFETSAGAADIAGPGTGAGGIGDGTGSGRWGDGDGGGGDETPPRQTKGRISDRDYPEAAADAGNSGTVEVRYVVATDGRVPECSVVRSSGSAILDETTCRLIRERFRFKPSRDVSGRPVASVIVQNHIWTVERDPTPER